MIRVIVSVLALVMATALPAQAEIEIEQITTPGGIDAWLVEEHSIPFVALEIRFRGGTSLDPSDKRGAVNLMAMTLDEGSGEMTARDYAKARDNLAMSISIDVSQDALSISSRFLSENREASVALLREVIANPRFDQEALERVRGQIVSVMLSDLKDPEAIAGRAYDTLIFGDHPYALSTDGTVESVTDLTREDLIAAHRAALTRDRIYVSAVGDITAEDLSGILDMLFEGLPETGPDLPQDATPNLPGGVKVIAFDTPQSVVRFAQPGIEREDPDFFAAYILNHILGGGGFESRLMTEVREKRGLTYGVYSYLSLADHANLWAGGTASANDRVAETVRVIREEWQKVHDTGVTEKELADAKTYLTGAYPLRFDGNGPIADIAVNMQIDDLPIDYIETRNDKIEAVTLEQINRVARERLDPDRLTFVVVGQPEGLGGTID